MGAALFLWALSLTPGAFTTAGQLKGDLENLCQCMDMRQRPCRVHQGCVSLSASARLVSPGSLCASMTPAAAFSRTKWEATALSFFFKVDSGTETSVTTDWLSHRTCEGPSRGAPNIRSSHRRPIIISAACFNAVDSGPKEEVSMLVCLLESHMTGALSMKTMTPVRDLRVEWSPA